VLKRASRRVLIAVALVALLVLAGSLIARFQGGSSQTWIEWMLFGGGAVLLAVLGLGGGLTAGPVRASRGGAYVDTSPPDVSLGVLLIPAIVICAGVLVHVLG
jgi:hypothetical protein